MTGSRYKGSSFEPRVRQLTMKATLTRILRPTGRAAASPGVWRCQTPAHTQPASLIKLANRRRSRVPERSIQMHWAGQLGRPHGPGATWNHRHQAEQNGRSTARRYSSAIVGGSENRRSSTLASLVSCAAGGAWSPCGEDPVASASECEFWGGLRARWG